MARIRYNDPFNLFLRFGLEVFGFWSYLVYPLYAFDKPWSFICAGVFPLLAALVWGSFRVENDGGKPKVKVSGKLRLLIEFVFFFLAVSFFYLREEGLIAMVFGLTILTHYMYSWQRVQIMWKEGVLENYNFKK